MSLEMVEVPIYTSIRSSKALRIAMTIAGRSAKGRKLNGIQLISDEIEQPAILEVVQNPNIIQEP
jgi:hypothetical protein